LLFAHCDVLSFTVLHLAEPSSHALLAHAQVRDCNTQHGPAQALAGAGVERAGIAAGGPT
jgi:hypothetical protein